MTQPFDKECTISPKGSIDKEAGEFWVNNPFEMQEGGHNLSAYEKNQFLINRPGSSFVNLSFESAANIDSDSRSAMVADFNLDGNPDLLVGGVGGGPLRLFINEIPHSNNRIRIDLRGTKSNRAAIGARLTLTAGGKQIVRDVFSANGFMGQAPAENLIGIGDAETVERLVIRWPCGDEQIFKDLKAGTVYGVTEGDDGAEKSASEGWRPYVRK